jgi:hypothetical protein
MLNLFYGCKCVLCPIKRYSGLQQTSINVFWQREKLNLFLLEMIVRTCSFNQDATINLKPLLPRLLKDLSVHVEKMLSNIEQGGNRFV